MIKILVTQELSDVQLVQSALKDPEAFAVFVERFQAPLRRYLLRLGCRESEDVDDVLQDVFLKVYINLNEYDTRLALSSWVYRIAHNEAVSSFRKKNVRPRLVESDEELRIFEAIIDDSDAVGLLDEKRRAPAIRAAMQILDGQSRDVMVLKYFEEKSYDEISDILKIPPGTVGTLVYRAKKMMKDVLISKNIHL